MQGTMFTARGGPVFYSSLLSHPRIVLAKPGTALRSGKKRGQATFQGEEKGARTHFAARGGELVQLVHLDYLVQRTK